MTAKSEFSRCVTIDPWPGDGHDFRVRAEPGECAALARRLDLIALDELSGEGRLELEPGTRVIVLRAVLRAQAKQTCVASLVPVPSHVEEQIERRFSRDLADPAEEIELDADAIDIEPLAGTTIDLGEVLAEELALALDPYPQADDGETPLPGRLRDVVTISDVAARSSPFAALRRLKD